MKAMSVIQKARVAVIVLGILLPYLARMPRGMEWVSQYTVGNLSGILLLGSFNAIAWGSILALSFLYRQPSSLLFPAAFGFGFLAFGHFTLDLESDAQAAISLAFIPIYALVPISVGALIGLIVDRKPWRRS